MPLITTSRVSAWTVAVIVGTIGVRAAQAPAKPFYKEWKMEDLLPAIADLGTGRDWNKGRELFKQGACGICHAFASDSEGFGLAPDLTGVGSKFTRDFILQSILEPSATLNPQFMQTTFTLKDGKTVTGSVIDVVDKKIVVAPIMMAPRSTLEIPQADVKSEQPATISAMPAGLVNGFTRDQIVELLAYLDAGGDRYAPVYRKK